MILAIDTKFNIGDKIWVFTHEWENSTKNFVELLTEREVIVIKHIHTENRDKVTYLPSGLDSFEGENFFAEEQEYDFDYDSVAYESKEAAETAKMLYELTINKEED